MFAPLFYFGVVQPASGMPVSLSNCNHSTFSCERIIVSSILKRVSASTRAAGWRHEYGAARLLTNGFPETVISASPSSTCAKASNGRGMLAQALSFVESE